MRAFVSAVTNRCSSPDRAASNRKLAFAPSPKRSQKPAEHFFVGDIRTLEGAPWDFCPRQVLRRALEAGATEIQPPTEMFYGASSASVRDPFGHVWVLLTWKEDLAPAEMERRGLEFFKR